MSLKQAENNNNDSDSSSIISPKPMSESESFGNSSSGLKEIPLKEISAGK
jgi:hypothetical protein